MKIKMTTQIDSSNWRGRVTVEHSKFDHPDIEIEEIDIEIHWVMEMRQLSNQMFEMDMTLTSIDLMVTAYNPAISKYVHFHDKMSDGDLVDWIVIGWMFNAFNSANGISNIELDYSTNKITLINF